MNEIEGLSNRVKELILASGKTWEQVVKETGLSSATLDKVYHNKNVYTHTWVKLCNYFGVSLSELVSFSPNGEK